MPMCIMLERRTEIIGGGLALRLLQPRFGTFLSSVAVFLRIICSRSETNARPWISFSTNSSYREMSRRKIISRNTLHGSKNWYWEVSISFSSQISLGSFLTPLSDTIETHAYSASFLQNHLSKMNYRAFLNTGHHIDGHQNLIEGWR